MAARALEERGIATVTLNLFREVAEVTKPPRSLFLNFPFGSPTGRSKDKETQTAVLQGALRMLEQSVTPGDIVDSDIKY